MSALIFADDRPTSCNDDLYQWAMDAEALIRNLHTENTALRVTEDNLRQELQECQAQRRAAFRRIEELEALRAQIGQGVPDGVLDVLDNFEKKERSPFQAYLVAGLVAGLVNELRTALLASAPPAPHPAFAFRECEDSQAGIEPQNSVVQQKPLTDEQINQMWSDAHNDTSPMSLIHVLARAIEAAHGIGDKK